MTNLDIDFSASIYFGCVYKFCKANRLSMMLKGSLSKGTEAKCSDIDLIILESIKYLKFDEIVKL